MKDGGAKVFNNDKKDSRTNNPAERDESLLKLVQTVGISFSKQQEIPQQAKTK
jgi:hypothetical protein